MLDTWEQEFQRQHPEYYPGSRHKIGQSPLIVNPGSPLDDIGKPRIYLVNNKEVEFYTTGQLAQALGRAAVTIRKWEREGIIPVASHRLPGRGGDPRGNRRLYTKEQVTGIVQIAAEEGLLKGDQKPIRNTEFTKRVIDMFRSTR